MILSYDELIIDQLEVAAIKAEEGVNICQTILDENKSFRVGRLDLVNAIAHLAMAKHLLEVIKKQRRKAATDDLTGNNQ